MEHCRCDRKLQFCPPPPLSATCCCDGALHHHFSLIDMYRSRSLCGDSRRLPAPSPSPDLDFDSWWHVENCPYINRLLPLPPPPFSLSKHSSSPNSSNAFTLSGREWMNESIGRRKLDWVEAEDCWVPSPPPSPPTLTFHSHPFLSYFFRSSQTHFSQKL